MRVARLILLFVALYLATCMCNPTASSVDEIDTSSPSLTINGSVQDDLYYEIVFGITGSSGFMSFIPDWVFQFSSDTAFNGTSAWPGNSGFRVTMVSYKKDVTDALFTCGGVFDSSTPSGSSSCSIIFSNSDMSLSDKMYLPNDNVTSSRVVSVIFSSVENGVAGTVKGTLVLDQANFFSWLGDSYSADRLVIIGMSVALIVVLVLSLITSCFAYACSSVEGPFRLSVAYPLCFFLGFTGAQRFYLGQPNVGKVYACSLGLLGFGWLFDLLFLSRLVTQSNLLALLMASEIQNGHYSITEGRTKSRGSSRGSTIGSSPSGVIMPTSSQSQFLRRSNTSSNSMKHVHIADSKPLEVVSESISDDDSMITPNAAFGHHSSSSSLHRSSSGSLKRVSSKSKAIRADSDKAFVRPTTSVAVANAKSKMRKGHQGLSKEQQKKKMQEAKLRKKEFQAKQKAKKIQAKQDKKLLKAALKKNNIIVDDNIPTADEEVVSAKDTEQDMVIEDV